MNTSILLFASLLIVAALAAPVEKQTVANWLEFGAKGRTGRGIVGTDDRTMIDTVLHNFGEPYAALVCISHKTKLANGTWIDPAVPVCDCTGATVSKRHVLTAGHCIYDTNGDKIVSNLYPSPLDGVEIDFGVVPKFTHNKLYAPDNWKLHQKQNFDYGLMRTRKNNGVAIGDIHYIWDNNTFHMHTDARTLNVNDPINNVAYQEDKMGYRDNIWMYGSSAAITNVKTHNFEVPFDTVSGAADGSPCYVYEGMPDNSGGYQRPIVGIYTHRLDGTETSTSANVCMRITETKHNQICNWIKEATETVDACTLYP